MILLKVILTTRENQYGVAHALTDFELSQDSAGVIPMMTADRLTTELLTRARDAEGPERAARNDRILVQASRSEAIGCDPVAAVSIGFPARLCDGDAWPQLAYARMIKGWILRLCNAVTPPKETPAQ